MRAIWTVLKRVEQIPEIGKPTTDPGIRQIVVRFGRAGYWPAPGLVDTRLS